MTKKEHINTYESIAYMELILKEKLINARTTIQRQGILDELKKLSSIKWYPLEEHEKEIQEQHKLKSEQFDNAKQWQEECIKLREENKELKEQIELLSKAYEEMK